MTTKIDNATLGELADLRKTREIALRIANSFTAHISALIAQIADQEETVAKATLRALDHDPELFQIGPDGAVEPRSQT